MNNNKNTLNNEVNKKILKELLQNQKEKNTKITFQNLKNINAFYPDKSQIIFAKLKEYDKKYNKIEFKNFYGLFIPFNEKDYLYNQKIQDQNLFYALNLLGFKNEQPTPTTRHAFIIYLNNIINQIKNNHLIAKLYLYATEVFNSLLDFILSIFKKLNLNYDFVQMNTFYNDIKQITEEINEYNKNFQIKVYKNDNTSSIIKLDV